jgi:hypothetical protein
MVLAVRVVPPAAEAAGLEAAADEAGLLPAAAGVLPEVVELLPELAHADTVNARAASAAVPHIFRISDLSPS